MTELASLTDAQKLNLRKYLDGYLGRASFPGLGPKFDRAVEGMRKLASYKFGTGTAPDSTFELAVAITDLDVLAQHFNAYLGEYDMAGNYIGGTGLFVINSEIQNYMPFGAGNHVMQADSLRLKALAHGTAQWGPKWRGDLKTTASVGYTTNNPGASPLVATPIADLNLRGGEIDQVAVGDVVTNTTSGLAWVMAKDTGAGTLTFGALSGGGRIAQKANWHISHVGCFFAPLDSSITLNPNVTNQLYFAAAVPAAVLPGMTIRGCKPNGSIAGSAFQCLNKVKVASISGDRRTVTMDGLIDMTGPGNNLQGALGHGILFLPGVTSGQIASKRAWGANQPGQEFCAVRVKFRGPAMPQLPDPAMFSRDQLEAVLAVVQAAEINGKYYPIGSWPAIWGFNARPNADGTGQQLVSGYRTRYNEIDLLELFCQLARAGGSEWTGNLHDQLYTCMRSLQPSFTDMASAVSARNGGAWQVTSSLGDSRNKSDNASRLKMPAPLSDGTVRSVGFFQSRERIAQYLDDDPIRDARWSADNDYPMQIIANLSTGSLGDGYCASCMWPQRHADLTSQFWDIASIEVYGA